MKKARKTALDYRARKGKNSYSLTIKSALYGSIIFILIFEIMFISFLLSKQNNALVEDSAIVGPRSDVRTASRAKLLAEESDLIVGPLNAIKFASPKEEMNQITDEIIETTSDTEYVEYEDLHEDIYEQAGPTSEIGSIGSRIVRNIPPEHDQELFFSGIGTSDNDKMNYMDYEAELYFSPFYDLMINTIKPEIYSCIEKCHYELSIYDERGNLLTRSVTEGTGPEDFAGVLEEDILLKGNHKYRIHQHIWSSDSVGIFTAGREDIRKNNAEYEIVYAKSKYYVDYNNRGPISFSMFGFIQDSREFKSASWQCRKTTKGRRGEIVIYEIDDLEEVSECRNREEWGDFALELCNTFCSKHGTNGMFCEFEIKKLSFGDVCD